MENASDIKTIMARLQARGLNAAEGQSEPPARSEPPGRLKQPVQPSLSTGTKKPPFESFSGNLPPKPSFLKNTASTNIHPSGSETNKTTGRPVMPHKVPLSTKPNFSEVKDAASKPLFTKPPLTSSNSDLKPAFPKPPQGLNTKPSWVMNRNGSSPSSVSPPPKISMPNQMSSSRPWQQSEEKPNDDAPKKFPPSSNTHFKPSSTFRNLQSNFSKDTEKTEVTIEAGNKASFPAPTSVPPPIPAPSKKPSLKVKSGSPLNSGPKQKALPHPSTLGPPPVKPQRPPYVNLDIFRAADTSNGSHIFKKGQTPAASNVSNTGPPVRTSQGAAPNLPQRHGTIIQSEEIYDDVEEVIDSNSPPPLPPMTSHPSQGAKEQSDDDGEMYEDLEDRWDEQNIEKDKDEKEQKKRLEAERKEQKEREKKEQDGRKKFKLVGPMTVIHQGKALMDCRGSKTDLALKQGESLDIIRTQGNPEGKWLGRNQDGSIGYVKITSVKIDFNSLKNYQTQKADDQEVYDDIEQASSGDSAAKEFRAEDDEIYDDVVDAELHDSSFQSRSSYMKARNLLRIIDRNRRPSSSKVAPPPCPERSPDQRGAAVDEEIYDDVDAQSPPLLPPVSSIPTLKNKNKGEEIDPKRQKKMEKEEKEFRKKFKYEGEIQVLDQVTVLPTMTNKKWSGKELSIKAGEKLDVIVKPVDNKMVCRNAEGKFGYVATIHIVTDDGEIYDDVGEDCIYDND
ncbi:FYN-binding protein 1 isoform X1 [Synchiropus splendidus]|uniref:FYN-binding protein 1 isoform X1 n=1 Tax=Synchiropus splendidus TaxID=270530 RepID=UPI00237E6B90|nr:FYN-binding protein 1 isoform X1 [Synchiropus splendidus]